MGLLAVAPIGLGHRAQVTDFLSLVLNHIEVVTFETLHLHRHRGELDQDQLLSAVMVIADEADLQLGEAVRSLTEREH